jgi:Tol biopolymer transport system component
MRSGMLAGLVLAVSMLAFLPVPGSAQQYFGRNKVKYDNFQFKVLKTDHFNIYYYPEEAEAVSDAARMAERWYERYARTFQHEFEQRKPIILYADHPDYEQTNAVSGFISQGEGGVTESLKNRVIIPFTGSYWDDNHVIGHELVHAFQYNIAEARPRGVQGLNALPLWLIEGMAEYFSLGRDNPLTAMWMRDALIHKDFPTIHQMTTERRFFPYRFGQALLAYIGGIWGDDAVVQIYRRSLQMGFKAAVQQVLGMSTDTLSVRWKDEVAKEYEPLMKGRETPAELGKPLLAPQTGAGSTYNVSPSLSPDGRYVAFLADKDLFSVDLYLADAHTGKIIRKLRSANSDPHTDALRYIDSSGTWSPDGKYFCYVATADGTQELQIVRVDDGTLTQRKSFPEIGAMANPSWSPDGKQIAFTGMVGGISDLFIYDLDSGRLIRLTNDKYADFEPSWSPDGKTIAFASDRGPETNFAKLTFSKYQLSFINVATHEVHVVPVFGDVNHINPQYAPDGKSVYFVSDQDGFSDVYRLNLATDSVERVTHLATAVSGITYTSPAISVASNSGRLVYTVFDSLQFDIFAMDPQGKGTPVKIVDNAQDQSGRMLPPAHPQRFSRVASYLADAETGLKPPHTYAIADAKKYSPSLSLDWIGQPSFGVAADRFGSYVAGGVSAYFSDMLGDRNLGVSVSAQGRFKDIGGQVFYMNSAHRWNWGVGAGRIPYVFGSYGYGADTVDANGKPVTPQSTDSLLAPYLGLYQYHVYVNTLTGQVAYPFSETRRLELGLGATRYSYDIVLDKYYMDQYGRVYNYTRQDLQSQAPPPLNMVQASVALVGDNSYFGFTSPVRGGRYRLEVDETTGDVNFTTLIADWRRYYSPTKNLTIAVRGMHFGRYGLTQTDLSKDQFGILQPLFLGYPTLIRGYDYNSFNASECAPVGSTTTNSNACPVLSRLFGQRIAVANLEVRIPVLGVRQYGLINFPYLPTDLVLFADAGAAWDPLSSAYSPTQIQWQWSRNSQARVPIFSTGVAARFNVMGMLVLEAYYAHPFQRPQKNWVWGINIAPGW